MTDDEDRPTTDFSPEYLASLKALAVKRVAAVSAKGGRHRFQAEGYSSEDAHFDGMRAELAVHRFLGLVYTPRCDGRSDGQVDVVFDGRTGQVKYTRRHDGALYFGDGVSRLETDFVVLAAPPPPIHRQSETEVRLIGWLPSTEFFRLAVRTSFGYNTVQAVAQARLRPMRELRSWDGRA